MVVNIGALFSWKTTVTPMAWSIGDCPYCKQPQPIRLEDETRSFCFALIPLTSKLLGRFLRCDFCQRPFDGATSVPPVSLTRWEPSQGVSALASLLGVADRLDVAGSPGESAIRSLLKSADDRSSWNALDVGGGLLGGAIFGLLGGGLLAVVGYQLKFTLGEMDEVGTAICVPLLATIGCAIGASLLQAVRHRSKVPYRVLERSVRDYQVDTMELQRLAAGFSRRTRNAADRLL